MKYATKSLQFLVNSLNKMLDATGEKLLFFENKDGEGYTLSQAFITPGDKPGTYKEQIYKATPLAKSDSVAVYAIDIATQIMGDYLACYNKAVLDTEAEEAKLDNYEQQTEYERDKYGE